MEKEFLKLTKFSIAALNILGRKMRYSYLLGMGIIIIMQKDLDRNQSRMVQQEAQGHCCGQCLVLLNVVTLSALSDYTANSR